MWSKKVSHVNKTSNERSNAAYISSSAITLPAVPAFQLNGKDKGDEKRKPSERTKNNKYSSSKRNSNRGNKRGLRSWDNNKKESLPNFPKKVLWRGDRGQMRWYNGVRDNIFNAAKPNKNGEYYCKKCKQWFPRDEMQVDHNTDWWTYVVENSDYEQHEIDGHLWNGHLLTDVLDAYNDEENLCLMCGSCNSVKSGPKDRDKNMYDYVGPTVEEEHEDYHDNLKKQKKDEEDDEDGNNGFGGGMNPIPVNHLINVN